MITFESVNELTLKITNDGDPQQVYTKAGAFIAGESQGGKNYQFEKCLLGPGGSPMKAALSQLARRFTGENLPLMIIKSSGPNATYYANLAQHVTVLRLNAGQTLSVESENLLAFVNCKYSVRFLAQGVISQKGLATSTLTGEGSGGQVAVLSDGNPMVLSNMDSGHCLTADPDAVVCWSGVDPSMTLDVSWKNLIGQASGESYVFEWHGGATILVQPNERISGVDIGIDGRGGQPTIQRNSLFR